MWSEGKLSSCLLGGGLESAWNFSSATGVSTFLSALFPLALFLFLCPQLQQGAKSNNSEYFPPPDTAGGWRTLKDAAAIRKVAGMDLQKLDQAFTYAQRSSQHG